MRRFSKKRWFGFVAGLLCFSLTAAAVTSYSWYFKPAAGHVVPEVIPEASSFIGNHAVIYLGSPEEKRVYLTFDAGYENGNVEKILNVLKETGFQNVRCTDQLLESESGHAATWFIIAKKACQ